MDINSVVHWFIIDVRPSLGNDDIIERMKWSGLTFALRCKYDWYFRYRAALLQVKYPRMYVSVRWGHEPAIGKTAEHILNNKIIAKKRKLTEYENKILLAKNKWNYLFPIEQDVHYLKAIEKINRLKFELQTLQNN